MFSFIVPLTMQHVVELLPLIKIGNCGYLISCSASLILLPCLTLRNKAPNLASATDAITNLSTMNKLCIALFSLIGSLLLGSQPGKKWPATLLMAFCSDK